ncbi:MAG: Rid family detoxifying hydrolase [Bacteroidetes bacterium]|nr:Rid family detoxifying hydrolase [Bacteroidota bacterium]
MKTHFIPGAPAAIGPYCHAVRTGNLYFLSGQTPLDPDTMKLVGESIAEQTEKVFDNISTVLEGLGLSLSNVVKTTVYLRSMRDFAGMNAVYEARFEGHKPARTTIAVQENPMDAMVEIECVVEAE